MPPPIVMDFAERWPVAEVVETNSIPKPTTPTTGDRDGRRPKGNTLRELDVRHG